MLTISHTIKKGSTNITFPLILKLLPVQLPQPHEMVVSPLAKELKEEISTEGLLKDPILADKESLTVLDGMHRLKVAKELNLDFIPVCLIDYASEAIKLGSWCRKLSSKETNEELKIAEIKNILEGNFEYKQISLKKALETLHKSQDSFLIVSLGERKALKGKGGTEKYWRIKALESKLKNAAPIKITYEADTEVMKNIERREGIFLFPPSISKETVLKHNKPGKLLPPKTTRHVFPARPLFVNTPLPFLKDTGEEKKKSKKFEESLQEKKIEKIKGGQKIEGRFYEEKWLYCFSDERR